MNDVMPLAALPAYRAFRVKGDRLFGPIQGSEWEPGPNESRCGSCGPVPGRKCRCGFYSFRTQTYATQEWGEQGIVTGYSISGTPVMAGGSGLELVLATVHIWGTIWPATAGYRSEMAQITDITTTDPNVFAGVLTRYDISASLPPSKEERGLCDGILYGIETVGPGDVILKVAGLTMEDPSGEFHIDPMSGGYDIASRSIGMHVALTFERRDGSRWVTAIT